MTIDMQYAEKIDLFWDNIEPYLSNGGRERAEATVAKTNQVLPVALTQLGLVQENQILDVYEKIFDIPTFQLNKVDSYADANWALSDDFLLSKKILPYMSENSSVVSLAMVDPFDEDAKRAIAFATGKSVHVEAVGYSVWRDKLQSQVRRDMEANDDAGASTNMIFDSTAGWSDDASRLRDLASEAPVIQYVESLLARAFDERASDIHVEPSMGHTRIRFRVDGIMKAHSTETEHFSRLVASRLKVMCEMDVADSRSPQDGRTSTAVRGQPLDLRVSTVPTVRGESLVVRLLHRSESLLNLEELGFSEINLHVINKVIANPTGIFLITGPTGSGKTTTLYAIVNKLRKKPGKILTIEDPIEYFFEDISQTQVNEAAGVNFASALRSFLRQDPDIILVGEIRDPETAKIAVQASLTGHLVLSTLHTNDALSAIPRLKDLGIPNYLIGASLGGVVAQRLVRKKCPRCVTIASEKSACELCNGNGFSGRTVICEAFLCSSEIKSAIREGEDLSQIQRMVAAAGFCTMKDDGFKKAKMNNVEFAEVLAVTGDELA